MFSFRRKESCPLQIYGKLPLAKDYLRIGCGSAAGLKLREWMDQGFSGNVSHSQQPVLPWPMYFLTGEAWGAPLLGCAWPSSDAGGLRRFPFVALVERRKKALAEEVGAGLDACISYWERLEALYLAHRNSQDGKGLLAALRGQLVVADGDAEGRVRAPVDWMTWTRALFGNSEDEVAVGLQAVLERLDGLQRSNYQGPLRLPLVSDLAVMPQVHAWWKVLTELGLLDSGDVPTLFCPQRVLGAEVAFVTVFLGEPKVEEVAWLTSLSAAELGAGDLCGGIVRVAGDVPPAPENAPLLADSFRGAWISYRARSGGE